MATEMNTKLIQDEGRNREILARIPAGRWGTPEDLKGLAVFLSSEASNYINGAVIPVDGGYLGRWMALIRTATSNMGLRVINKNIDRERQGSPHQYNCGDQQNLPVPSCGNLFWIPGSGSLFCRQACCRSPGI